MSIPYEAASRLARFIGRLAFLSARCLHQNGAEEVHDVRVAVRRLDQGLRLFAKWLPKKQVRRIRARLRAVLDAAAAVRDCDIAEQVIGELAIPVSPAIAEALKARRHADAGRLTNLLKRMVDSGFSAKWRDRLELAASDRKAFPKFAQIASEVLPRDSQEFIEAGSRLAHHPKSKNALHSFRISAKRLRYSLEPFAELYGPSLEQRVAAIRKVQTALGNFNDCVATRRLLKELGAGVEPKRLLREEEAKRLEHFQTLWPKLFPDTAARNWKRFLKRAPSPGRAGARARGRGPVKKRAGPKASDKPSDRRDQ